MEEILNVLIISMIWNTSEIKHEMHKAVHGTEYRVGSTSELLWTAPGNSVDQAYEIHGIKLGFTIEMRRGFNTGNIFILPKEEIIPNAEEVVGSIVAMVKAAEELEYMDVAIEPTN